MHTTYETNRRRIAAEKENSFNAPVTTYAANRRRAADLIAERRMQAQIAKRKQTNS